MSIANDTSLLLIFKLLHQCNIYNTALIYLFIYLFIIIIFFLYRDYIAFFNFFFFLNS